MSRAIDHEEVRRSEDRAWTFALLDEVRAPSTSDHARREAFRTLGFLEDYRAIEPLTAIVEEAVFPESVRDGASEVLTGFDDRTTPDQRRRWWNSGDQALMKHSLRLMERTEADLLVAVAGDDRHPLQAFALAGMAFGFDEPQFQEMRIRALESADAAVRSAAANVLVWDEPVAAEAPLVGAISDLDVGVTLAATDTLQYYPSRRVLRVLAELSHADDERLQSVANASLDYAAGRFEDAAMVGRRDEVLELREWMQPVADLVTWGERVVDRGVPLVPSSRVRTAASASEIVEAVQEPNGRWASKKEQLRGVAWDAFTRAERELLCDTLAPHPDPRVREVATTPLALWAEREQLLSLASDAHLGVRKAAVYALRTVDQDAAVAAFAWDHVLALGGTAGREALQTYVAHAAADEAKRRLTELARTDRRESVVTTAITCLVDLRGGREVESLVPLLADPPPVSWAAHIEILRGLEKLQLAKPELGGLLEVDNLDLIQSVVSLRCARHGR